MAASFGSGKFDLPEGDWVHYILSVKETIGDGFLSEADKKAGKTAAQKEQFEWTCNWHDGTDWQERKIWTGQRFLPISSIKSSQFTPAIHRLCTATKYPIPQSRAEAEAFGGGDCLTQRYFVVKVMANPENPEELKEFWVQYPEQEAAPGFVDTAKAAPKAPAASPAAPATGKAGKAPAAPPVPPAAAAAVTGDADEYE